MDIIEKYKDTFKSLDILSEMEPNIVYTHLISLGKKLQHDPLSEEKRLPENQVTYCQYKLYVDIEDGKFKAYSDAMIASGYAYMLVDIFNTVNTSIDAKEFDVLNMDNILSMNRTSGFFQMIEIMNNKL
jgi:sulfur transfer protein SufE